MLLTLFLRNVYWRVRDWFARSHPNMMDTDWVRRTRSESIKRDPEGR